MSLSFIKTPLNTDISSKFAASLSDKSKSYSLKKSAYKIGEGTYGCLHRPSLICADDAITPNDMNYEGKVSKILTNEEAEYEYDEYSQIKKLDPEDKYFLKIPIKCNVGNNSYNINAIKDCHNTISITKFLIRPKSYSLLVMEDGGMNLEEYIEFYHPIMKIDTLEKILIEFHNVFQGIKLLLDNGIIHNDIKPQNLLINNKTGNIRIIDMSITMDRKEAIEKCKKSKLFISKKFNWSSPFESVFINKEMFLLGQNNLRNKQYTFFKRLFSDKQIRSFFEFIVDYEDIQKIKREYNYYILNDFAKKHKDGKISYVYDKFVEKHFNTKDIYGAGISCFYLLQKCGKRLLSSSTFNTFHEIFYHMITPNLNKRYDINELLDEYTSALYTTGILHKHPEASHITREPENKSLEKLIDKSTFKKLTQKEHDGMDMIRKSGDKNMYDNNILYSLLSESKSKRTKRTKSIGGKNRYISKRKHHNILHNKTQRVKHCRY